MSRIAIIGAGITGVTTAYALSQRGYDVTVFDRHRYAAMETSFANGGQLSASNAEVWNSTATLLKGLRWMLTRDAPLLFNPLPSWHKYSWIAEFLRHIANYRENTIETVRLAIEARRHLFEIAEREHIDFDLERRGILHVYQTRKEYDAALKVTALLREGGLDRDPVSPAEIGRIEPALQGDFIGGFLTPSDSTGDIHKFTRGLADACVRRGVHFSYDTEIASITQHEKSFTVTVRHEPDRESGSHGERDGHNEDAPPHPVRSNGIQDLDRYVFDKIVVCAGVKSREIGAMLGDHVNVYPVKGYSITVCLDDEESRHGAPWVSLLDDHAKIVTSRLGADRFRVAGTAEINGFNRDIRADRIQPLIDWTRRHFPAVGTARVIPWAGLRPMLPAMLPKVAAGKRRGVFYNTGHGHLGWTLSAATAECIAALIADNDE
jgi:D-amino-acid dehydrogenase